MQRFTENKNTPTLGQYLYPNKKELYEFVDTFFEFVFIQKKIESPSESKKIELEKSFQKIISYEIVLTENIELFINHFWSSVDEVYTKCLKDAQAIFEFDPAAENMDEVIHIYPGFFAISIYRFANYLWGKGLKIIPRMISEYVHSKTGIDIHPAAQIGNSFAIDHGTGIVIGATTIIGNNVKLYQGVTLGALQVSKALKDSKRHPTIEDNVILYSNATILGGKTIIGTNCVIGGNVWITKSILPNSLVYHKSEIIIKEKYESNEAINFVI